MEKFLEEGHAYKKLYEVVKVVEAVVYEDFYRIEIVRDAKPTDNQDEIEYVARYFKLETFNALPKFPGPGEESPTPRDFHIWVEDFGYPHAYGPTAPIALNSALSKLEGGG